MLRLRFNMIQSDPAMTKSTIRNCRARSKGITMKIKTIVVVTGLVFIGGLANAQTGVPSGRGSTSGDPAASSATPGRSPTTGGSMKSSRSGSGTSTSGGSDANGDQGRDKMPDSSQGVKPLNQQNKPDKM